MHRECGRSSAIRGDKFVVGHRNGPGSRPRAGTDHRLRQGDVTKHKSNEDRCRPLGPKGDFHPDTSVILHVKNSFFPSVKFLFTTHFCRSLWVHTGPIRPTSGHPGSTSRTTLVSGRLRVGPVGPFSGGRNAKLKMSAFRLRWRVRTKIVLYCTHSFREPGRHRRLPHRASTSTGDAQRSVPGDLDPRDPWKERRVTGVGGLVRVISTPFVSSRCRPWVSGEGLGWYGSKGLFLGGAPGRVSTGTGGYFYTPLPRYFSDTPVTWYWSGDLSPLYVSTPTS